MHGESGKIRVFHTSDWHLGRLLHEQTRDAEYDAFLAWLLEAIEREKIDVLLIAGDIFDTSNPTHAAQQRYYEFCTKLSRTCCRHAVITSGNHDSTSFIDVPSDLLYCLNVHVIGQPRFGVGKSGDPADEVVVLKDAQGNDELIVAAVPFLSDGDVRFSSDGEDTQTKEQKMIAGVSAHYRAVAEAAERIRAGREIPVIGMGHLYVDGGIHTEDDGVRVTYIGMLGGVGASVFPAAFDYVALGHLHVPQSVGGSDRIRYSGSPLAMGFGEAGQQKSLCKIEFEGKTASVSLCEIPCFHRMARIAGDKPEIEQQIRALIEGGEATYISVTYTGTTYIDSVQELVDGWIGDAGYIRCLYTQNNYIAVAGCDAASQEMIETLDVLDEKTVFGKLVDEKCPGISAQDRGELMETFNELLIISGL